MVNGVLRPFFAGVLLEQGMTTSRRFTDLMMRMFALGRSTVPAGACNPAREDRVGLPEGTVELNTPVRRVDSRQVETPDGRVSPAPWW